MQLSFVHYLQEYIMHRGVRFLDFIRQYNRIRFCSEMSIFFYILDYFYSYDMLNPLFLEESCGGNTETWTMASFSVGIELIERFFSSDFFKSCPYLSLLLISIFYISKPSFSCLTQKSHIILGLSSPDHCR
jgi:hypothetical protein